MEEAFRFTAFVAGAAAVAYPLVTALFNVGRLFHAHGDHLVVDVGLQRFVIDVGAFDREEIEIIDSARRALEERSLETLLQHQGEELGQDDRHAA